MYRFALILPIGAGAVPLYRGAELIKSVLRWEPALDACVVIDSSPTPRGLASLSMLPPTCRRATITQEPIENRCEGTWFGRLSANVLKALSWIQENSDAEFVLRIDPDALVIGPFVERVRQFVSQRPCVGLLGTLGLSCNPSVRGAQNLALTSRLIDAYRTWPPADAIDSSELAAPLTIEGFELPVTPTRRRGLDLVRPHIEAAMSHGYRTREYCQGGACVVTRSMIDRMEAANYFAVSTAWELISAPDDVVCSMYARAVGLDVADFSRHGEPFGVQHQGLAYPPAELLARGHSIIHSVKNDPIYSEARIREFFRTH